MAKRTIPPCPPLPVAPPTPNVHPRSERTRDPSSSFLNPLIRPLFCRNNAPASPWSWYRNTDTMSIYWLQKSSYLSRSIPTYRRPACPWVRYGHLCTFDVSEIRTWKPIGKGQTCERHRPHHSARKYRAAHSARTSDHPQEPIVKIHQLPRRIALATVAALGIASASYRCRYYVVVNQR